MNILLWILQILLAAHTGIGAFWKFSHNAEQTMPSLRAIPDGVWMGMSGLEIICSLSLILPLVYKPAKKWIAPAALVIVAEMLLFCVLHLTSGGAGVGPLIYWLVTAGICGFIAYGRAKLSP